MRDEAWPVRERIVAFARDASFELSPRDGAALAAAASLAPGSRVSITWLPRDADDDRVAAARALHDRGLVPVPHIAARMIEDEAHLAGLIGRLCGEAGVSQLLVIGGDAKQPRGPFAASTDLLSSPALAHPMVRRIAVGGYPEGHPWAGEALLDAKIAAIGALGVTAEVITQLCFDSGPILAWARVFRARHPEVPVRLGIAGPASIRTLLRYARICGVGNSAKALVARGGLDRTAAGGGGARSAAARSRGDSGHRRAGAGRGPPFSLWRLRTDRALDRCGRGGTFPFSRIGLGFPGRPCGVSRSTGWRRWRPSPDWRDGSARHGSPWRRPG
ncbi:hypothetical protein ACFOHO_15280 [Rhizorhabdus histidinilytica]